MRLSVSHKPDPIHTSVSLFSPSGGDGPVIGVGLHDFLMYLSLNEAHWLANSITEALAAAGKSDYTWPSRYMGDVPYFRDAELG